MQIPPYYKPVSPHLWGRLLTCGRLAIGLSRNVPSPRVWGSQSWLQPPFRRLLRLTIPQFPSQQTFPPASPSASLNALRFAEESAI
jgi:hypothetical protein